MVQQCPICDGHGCKTCDYKGHMSRADAQTVEARRERMIRHEMEHGVLRMTKSTGPC